MMTVDLTTGALIYLFSALGLISILWLYYDLRDKNLYEAERKKGIFYCVKCEHIYTGRHGSETACCPRCGFENARVRF